MKRNIVILSFFSFLFLAGLLYCFVEVIYKENFFQQENRIESDTVSTIELISPEIKTAFMKSDDIALLYLIEKLSKLKNVSEAFIIDNNLNIVIHNDSSKWNKKYNENFYKNIINLKTKSVQSPEPNIFVYSQPLNDKSVLCIKYSLQEIYDSFKMWKIKLYVYGFIVSFLMLFIVYYFSKFLFLRQFNNAKKYLSVNDISKKTIYSDIVNMALSLTGTNGQNSQDGGQGLKKLTNVILQNYLNLSDEIFIILDSKAKLVYCMDKENIVLDKQELDSHIVNLTKNSQILKDISLILENPSETINTDVEDYKINITPLKDGEDNFIGIIISGNTKKESN